MAYNTEQLTELVRDAEKCPRLTSWERGFMENIGSGLLRYGKKFEASPKQTEAIEKIENKVYAT